MLGDVERIESRCLLWFGFLRFRLRGSLPQAQDFPTSAIPEALQVAATGAAPPLPMLDVKEEEEIEEVSMQLVLASDFKSCKEEDTPIARNLISRRKAHMFQPSQKEMRPKRGKREGELRVQRVDGNSGFAPLNFGPGNMKPKKGSDSKRRFLCFDRSGW